MPISITTKTHGLIEAAAEKLNEHIGAAARPMLLLLSGGSSLSLVEHIDLERIDARVTIAMTDDRYSRDPAINNFLLLSDTNFFRQATERGANFISTVPQEDEDLAAYGRRFNDALKVWKKEYPEGSVVATMGVGPDGHCMGIFPFPEDQHLFYELHNDPSIWAVAYDVGEKNIYNERLTITAYFAQNYITAGISYVTGEAKRGPLERVLAKEGDLPDTPARLLRNIPTVDLYTDVALA